MRIYICIVNVLLLLIFQDYAFADNLYTKIELSHGISLDLPSDWQSKYEKERKLNPDRPVVLLAAAKPDPAGNVLAWLKIAAIADSNFFVPVDLAVLSQREKDKIISDTHALIGRGSASGKSDIKNISVTIESLNGYYCLKTSYLLSGTSAEQQQFCTTIIFNRTDIGVSVEAVFRSDPKVQLFEEINKILSTVVVGKK